MGFFADSLNRIQLSQTMGISAKARALAADRREMLAERIDEREAAALVDRLSESYLLAFDVDEMIAHADLLAIAPTVKVAIVPQKGLA